MILRTLNRQEAEREPYRIWNAFVDLLATSEFGDLSPEQRPAFLVFWYESEVENGGHLQYFENRGTEHLAATVEALGFLGATCHQQVLREAGEIWRDRQRPLIESVERFSEEALRAEFDMFDARFHECSPPLQSCLEKCLARQQEYFVRIE